MKFISITNGSGGIREAGDDPGPDVPADGGISVTTLAVQWAKNQNAKEISDVKDQTVRQIVDDVQALKDTVKTASSGSLTLTKAQILTFLRSLLYILKDDKSA